MRALRRSDFVGYPRPNRAQVIFRPPGLKANAVSDKSWLDLLPEPLRRNRSKAKHDLQGYGGILAVLAFNDWAMAQHKFPTVPMTMERFACSRATAYRWLRALAAHHRIEVPDGYLCGKFPHLEVVRAKR